MRGTLQERFDAKHCPEPNTGCWLWFGAAQPEGYGTMRVDGRYVKAHRVAWELHRGAIPEGLTIDHLCRNRACVNPDHLEPVSLRVNILRSDSASARCARATVCANGHRYTPETTRMLPNGWRQCRLCRREIDRRIRDSRTPEQVERERLRLQRLYQARRAG